MASQFPAPYDSLLFMKDRYLCRDFAFLWRVRVEHWLNRSPEHATYVEARAALARKLRERGLSRTDYRSLVDDLNGDWEDYFIVDVSDSVVKFAGGLAEKHALRGADAVHLASALSLRKQAGESVRFLCFDGRLTIAARKEGLGILK